MANDAQHSLERQADLLDEWVEARRRVAMWEARAAALLGERLESLDADVAVSPFEREAIWRSMVSEYAAAGRIAKGSAEIAFTDARSLRDDFPGVREAFDTGVVTAAHVREILRAASPITAGIADGAVEPSVLGLYEAAALEFAEREAPARTRTHLKELAAALAPQVVVEQHRAAEQERRMWARSFDDGVSILHLLAPTAKIEFIMDRARAIARDAAPDPDFPLPFDVEAEHAAWLAREHERNTGIADTYVIDPFLPGEPPIVHTWVPCPSGADNPEAAAACDAAMDAAMEAGSTPIIIAPDPRTADQLQADVVCDLLLGANPTEMMGTGLEGIRAHVQVTVAATTLAGLDDAPAQLDGHCAIDPDIARALAGQNIGWTRLFLDAEGFVTSTDTYTPTAGMRRFLKARDQHCRFPGCRQPVHRSELDHNLDYALGGKTDIHNLAHLCLSHHVLKHPDIPERYRWTARQRPDWTIEWTSPSGRSYIDAPPRRVMFVPSCAEPTPASGTATGPDDDPPPWDDFQPAAPQPAAPQLSSA
ncbi:HNH endonuclease signature motif containing protein [Microbacterium alcoholitolerans]|uniref:HNH endonuclease signature motif containing protein n=1 Tax=unclassified Microbacterium TaxID=2609290 RepID=UPI003D16C3FD